MRIEWLRQDARVQRWGEEIKRIQFEMGNGVQWFEWREAWWLSKIGLRTAASADVQSGLDAYARRQASVARGIAVFYVQHWAKSLQRHDLGFPWSLERYANIAKPTLTIQQSSFTDSEDENSDSGVADRIGIAIDTEDPVENVDA